MNPLLDFRGLPRFGVDPAGACRAGHRTAARGRARSGCACAAHRDCADWAAFVAPLEDANERLGRAWGQVSHLHAVLDRPALRETYNASLPKITQFWTELGQNQRLFEKYKALLRARRVRAALTPARKNIVENALRDFRLGGAELPAEKKQRFAEIQEELARSRRSFSENLLDATNAFSLNVEEERADVAGIPEDVLQAAREAAKQGRPPGRGLEIHAARALLTCR